MLAIVGAVGAIQEQCLQFEVKRVVVDLCFCLFVLQAIHQLQTRTSHAQSTGNNSSLTAFLVSAALDIFQTLIQDLDTEGRYLFLNAAANQLRYPNNHTHYFSFVLLYLYAEANQVRIPLIHFFCSSYGCVSSLFYVWK